MEKLIENTKEDYYRVLRESSIGWHTQEHNLMPWWNYFLSIIKSAYQDLKERMEISSDGDSKSSIIRQTVLAFPNPFSITDIHNLHPNIDRELIKKILFKLKNEKRISSIGKGRASRWKVV